MRAWEVVRLGVTAALAAFAGSWFIFSDWWADRVTVWRLRAEWKRRKRAQRAASLALNPTEGTRPFRRTEIVSAIAIGLSVGVAAAALLLSGCSSVDYNALGCDVAPAADAGTAAPGDAGAADHEPQCRVLGDGEEFVAAATSAATPVLILNGLCSRVCRNSAGGSTCIALTGELVDCARCQVSP